MIDFELTDDHKSAQQIARDVAHKYLKPKIADLDREFQRFEDNERSRVAAG